MNRAMSDVISAVHLTSIGYDECEAKLVAGITANLDLPIAQFSNDLMAESIHETAHQLMAVWLGCSGARAQLSLAWPNLANGRMISGDVEFAGVADRLSTRQAIAVAGVVAEWLMQRRGDDAGSASDEWDLFNSLRDGAWMSPHEREMTKGKITWHAVKRASRLLQRHWGLVSMSAKLKRTNLLHRLESNLGIACRRDDTLKAERRGMLAMFSNSLSRSLARPPQAPPAWSDTPASRITHVDRRGGH